MIYCFDPNHKCYVDVSTWDQVTCLVYLTKLFRVCFFKEAKGCTEWAKNHNVWTSIFAPWAVPRLLLFSSYSSIFGMTLFNQWCANSGDLGRFHPSPTSYTTVMERLSTVTPGWQLFHCVDWLTPNTLTRRHTACTHSTTHQCLSSITTTTISWWLADWVKI